MTLENLMIRLRERAESARRRRRHPDDLRRDRAELIEDHAITEAEKSTALELLGQLCAEMPGGPVASPLDRERLAAPP